MSQLERVPQVEELLRRGLAEPTRDKIGKPQKIYRISEQGQKLIYEAMARNAQIGRENDERRRAQVRPAPRQELPEGIERRERDIPAWTAATPGKPNNQPAVGARDRQRPASEEAIDTEPLPY